MLHSCDKIDVFFADVIEHELKKQEENPKMVFRGNSLATKSMEAYLKFIGAQYLKRTLQDTILEIYRKDECYEIDRQKLTSANGSGPDAKFMIEQQDKFRKLSHQVWTLIKRSFEYFPWCVSNFFYSTLCSQIT